MILILVNARQCQSQDKVNPMNDILRQNQLDDPEPLTVPTKKIEQAASASLPDEADSGGGEWITRAYSNAKANSRVALPLPAGEWMLDWKAELNPEYPPSQLMTMKERILVSADVWRLYESGGKEIARGSQGPGDLSADPVNGMFYGADNNGYIAARHSKDGKLAFSFSPAFGSTFSRLLISREGKKMLVISAEQPSDPHLKHLPDKRIVEVDDLGEKEVVDETGFLESCRESGKLIVRAMDFVVASTGQRVVFAWPGRMCWTDLSLAPALIFEDQFKPRSMSLDNAGRAFLIVQQEKKNALWVVAPNGIRLLSFEFPDGWNPTAYPPIVGFDHQISLVCREGLLLLSKKGVVTAKVPFKESFVGALVTMKGELILSTTASLGAVASDGTIRDLYTFTGETLTTPPALTPEGRLLVASKNGLFCLKVRN